MTYYAELLKSFQTSRSKSRIWKIMPVQNISYFMQVRMILCQSKQVDLLFSESLLRILTPKSAALTSIPLLPSLLSPFFPIKLFMRSEVRTPGKYSSSVPVMHFVLKRGGITTNGRTDGRSIRFTDAPADLSGRV